MSLGLAIFLSTLVISAVLLYHWGHLRAKQPNFNWWKGLKAVGIVAVAFILIGGAWLGYRYYENRPTTQTQYYDLALGMSMDDVLYVKGLPQNVYEDDPRFGGLASRVIAIDALDKQEKKKTVEDYYGWSFVPPWEQPRRLSDIKADEPPWERRTRAEHGRRNFQRLDVSFSPKTKKLTKILCYTNSDQEIYGACGVLGITTGMSEDDVINRLGKPEREKIEGVSKTIDYPNLNVTMYLTQRKVYMLIVRSFGDQ